jgi:hypothetical protein
MGSIKSYLAFQEPKGTAKQGEFHWTLMVKLLNVSKSDLHYEQFARGQYTLYFHDGSSEVKLMKDVTFRNPMRKSYGDWYEDMQAGESSGPKRIYDGDVRVTCSKIGSNEIFYQWWDKPGVGLDSGEEYLGFGPSYGKKFVGIQYDLEFSHKLWDESSHLFTIIVALTGENMMVAPMAKDTRMIVTKAAGRF